jgi:hypothetical protein
MKQTTAQPRMVAVQLSTDEGAFICNVRESDLTKIDAGKTGTLIVMYCAIRLDGLVDGRYELYRTKAIETSSVDFYQSLEKKERYAVRKGQLTLYARKRSKNG